MSRYNRAASLLFTLLGAFINCIFAVQLLAAWRAPKWEPESEWEASGDKWRVDGVRLLWGLFSAYFASAATVCAVGFYGMVKNKPTFVRFYRDYSIADFSFCSFFVAAATYAAFYTSVRAEICEELSRHPELMRDMQEMGLSLENCERWLERAVLASIAFMIVIMAVRLHFLLAVSNYYSYLTRHQQRANSLPTYADSIHGHAHSGTSHSRSKSLDSLQRIYLLPRGGAPEQAQDDPSNILVYAPVRLSSLPTQVAQDLRATAMEAWVTTTEPESIQGQVQRPHRHSHRRYKSISSSSSPSSYNRTGTICLPIRPDEGLHGDFGDLRKE